MVSSSTGRLAPHRFVVAPRTVRWMVEIPEWIERPPIGVAAIVIPILTCVAGRLILCAGPIGNLGDAAPAPWRSAARGNARLRRGHPAGASCSTTSG